MLPATVSDLNQKIYGRASIRMIVLKRSRAGEVRNVTAANQGVFERADAAQRRIK